MHQSRSVGAAAAATVTGVVTYTQHATASFVQCANYICETHSPFCRSLGRLNCRDRRIQYSPYISLAAVTGVVAYTQRDSLCRCLCY